MKLCIQTSDLELKQFIYLTLMSRKEVSFEEHIERECDIYLVDLDFCELPNVDHAKLFTFSYVKPQDLPLDVYFQKKPLTTAFLLSLLSNELSKTYLVKEHDHSVYLNGTWISLTKIEFQLFQCLFEKQGQFIAPEELAKNIFGTEGTTNQVRVYIHYLREKLEQDGMERIEYKRMQGYRLKMEETHVTHY